MINNVQVLRAIAAILVVFFHLAELVPEAQGLWYVPSGACGVDIFFVISGFVIAYSTGLKQGAGRFWVHRLIRVCPPYYLFVMAIIGVWLIAPHLIKTTTVDLESIVGTFAFIPYVKSEGRIMPILFVGWTLGYEMFFYTIFAIAMALSHRHRVLLASGAVIALTILGTQVDGLAHGPALYAFTRPIMLEFVIGMAVGANYPAIAKVVERHGVAPFAAILLVGSATLWVTAAINWGVAPILPDTRGFVRFGLPAAAIVLGGIGLDVAGYRVRNRLALLIGASSYALYLSHPFVAIAAGKTASYLGLSFGGRLAMMMLASVIAIICSIIFYQLVEKRMVRSLNRFVFDRRARQSVPQPVIPPEFRPRETR